jgi:membrane-bound lytic murein transglycosylase
MPRKLFLLGAAASILGVAAAAQLAFLPGATLPDGRWPDHTAALCEVASETRRYLEQGSDYDPAVIHGGRFQDPAETPASLQTPAARIRDTLAFVCEIHAEDQRHGRPSRLADPQFIAQHFEQLRWQPDKAGAARLAAGKPLLANLPEDRLLLTKYYVRMADGHDTQTNVAPHALYGLPFDEADLSLEEADARREQITRYRFGKQRIVELESSPAGTRSLAALAPPLIRLSRADLEGALLQGTAVVTDPSGQRRYFNVHRNNGVAYDRARKPEEQERYWYFKEVPGVLGYGKDADYKIPVRPLVTVAGDVFQLGLGRLILLRTIEAGEPTYRLTVLADTGGAFHDNLYQLDWLSGYYRDWDHYHAANRHIGDYAQAWLLLKRESSQPR